MRTEQEIRDGVAYHEARYERYMKQGRPEDAADARSDGNVLRWVLEEEDVN